MTLHPLASHSSRMVAFCCISIWIHVSARTRFGHLPCGKRSIHFLFLHGAQDNGTLLRFLTTLYSPTFGERLLTEGAEGGVGVMAGWRNTLICGGRYVTIRGTPG